MTRIQQYQQEVNEIARKIIRANMPEPKMLDAEICWDLKQSETTASWTIHKVASGLEKNFITELGMKKCLKSEAHILLTIGEKSAEGFFLIGKTKNYWLKPV